LKESNLKYCLLLSAALLLALPAFSAEYFVSNSGNNSNSGTISNPFKTIRYAVSKIKGGDIIYIRAGTYNEPVELYEVTGTELKRTTVSAYNGETVIIDGTGINVGSGNGLVRSFSQFTQFIGLTVRNSDQFGITLDQNNAAHSIVSHCNVSDCVDTGIGEYADYCIIEYSRVYNTSLNNEGGILSVGWASGIACRGTSSRQTTGSIIRHNEINYIWGEGINVAWVNICTVEDNIVYDCYSASIYNRNSQNVVNQRNLIYNTKIMTYGSQVGLGHWNEGSFVFVNKNNKYINNLVYGCRRNFYHYGATDGLLVANNTFVNSAYYACVQLDNRSEMVNCLFENNIVIQEDNLPAISVGSGSGLIFQSNLYNKSHSNSNGAGDVTGDPRLVKGNIENADYFKLMSDSPAIDKGSSITGASVDFFGNTRDITDIGACEYLRTTSIKDESKKLNIIVEKYSVKIFTEEAGVANLTNLQGIVVSSRNVNPGENIFDTSSFLPGIYIIVYYNRNSLKTGKLIITK
jgi:hypothetical protein